MEFEYQRKQGKRLTYNVKLFLTINAETGAQGYSAKVYRPDGDICGNFFGRKLISTDPETAQREAQSLVIADIEDLVEVAE